MNTYFTPPENAPVSEPYLNIPPLTGILTILLFGVFLITTYMPGLLDQVTAQFAFIPPLFIHEPLQHAYTLLTYGLLHYGWAHILMNTTGLMAFGSGIERIMGATHYLVIFIGGVILGALGHSILFSMDMVPLGGASAGVSALFGAIIPFVTPPNQLRRIVILFITCNILMGTMGMPNEPGISIAWQAHIVGFVFGLIYGRCLYRKTHPVPLPTQDAITISEKTD